MRRWLWKPICAHLDEVNSVAPRADGCEECLAIGDRWVHLRLCLTCGPFNSAVENPHVDGRDPQGRSYVSFASFADPDGNGWLLQEIRTRLPGREWNVTQTQTTDIATMAALLREAAERHDRYKKTHARHDWWDWYAPSMSARQNGSSREEAVAVADRSMEKAREFAHR